MFMKKFVVLVVFLLYCFIGVHVVFADSRTQKADFGGTERSDAIAFSIVNEGYIEEDL